MKLRNKLAHTTIDWKNMFTLLQRDEQQENQPREGLSCLQVGQLQCWNGSQTYSLLHVGSNIHWKFQEMLSHVPQKPSFLPRELPFLLPGGELPCR